MSLKRITVVDEVAQIIRIHTRGKEIGAGEIAEMIVTITDEAHDAIVRELENKIDTLEGELDDCKKSNN